MKTKDQILQIVDSHRQLSRDSCSPSLVELLLKIEGKVSINYFDLQKKYQDQDVGLVHFDQQNIEGLYFQKHDLSTGQPYIDRLRDEWKQGRIIGLYCVSPNSPDRKRHGWIVHDLEKDRIHLLSKYSELGNGEGLQTAKLDLSLVGQNCIEITDLLFYTVPSETTP